jgi:hypothetical protein
MVKQIARAAGKYRKRARALAHGLLGLLVFKYKSRYWLAPLSEQAQDQSTNN